MTEDRNTARDITADARQGPVYQAGRDQIIYRTTDSDPHRKTVMVIYGHDKEANTALFDWLRAIGLQPREWDQLIHASGDASPYIGTVLDQAFKDAQAVIAFFTPDERVRPRGHSGPWRLQARPNVLIEAGMALVTHPKQTIFAVLGPQELPSDLAGRHYIRLSHASPEPLHVLASRLRDAGCDVDLNGTDWLNPARFPNRNNLTQHPTESARPRASISESPEDIQAISKADSGHFLNLPSFNLRNEIESGEYEDIDLSLCGRIQLNAGFGSFQYVTESSRARILASLNSDEAALTGANSGVIKLMSSSPNQDSFGAKKWCLHGPNNSRRLRARWQGVDSEGRRLIEARVHAELIEVQDFLRRANQLRISINLLLANPSRFLQRASSAAPFLNLGDLQSFMLDIIKGLWGGQSITWLLADRPKEDFVALDMIIFTIPGVNPFEGYDFDSAFDYPKLDECIDFGRARLVPGNTPGKVTHFDPKYDVQAESLDSPANIVHDWLVQLGIDNGFQNVQQEIERWTG